MATGLYIAHGMALIAAFANAWTWAIDCFLAYCAITSFWFNLNLHCKSPGIQTLEFKADGRWFIFFKDGRSIEASLLADTWVTPWLVILQMQTHQGEQSLLLCRDSLDAEAFRELRVRLKLTPLTRNVLH